MMAFKMIGKMIEKNVNLIFWYQTWKKAKLKCHKNLHLPTTGSIHLWIDQSLIIDNLNGGNWIDWETVIHRCDLDRRRYQLIHSLVWLVGSNFYMFFFGWCFRIFFFTNENDSKPQMIRFGFDFKYLRKYETYTTYRSTIWFEKMIFDHLRRWSSIEWYIYDLIAYIQTEVLRRTCQSVNSVNNDEHYVI